MVESKAAFNVVVPFDGVTIIQLNKSMAELLADFLESFEDEIEPELDALLKSLDRSGSWSRKASGAAFSVDIFEGVVTVQVNQAMSNLIKDCINESDDIEVELRALGKAIENPIRCAELRRQRHLKRREERESDSREGQWGPKETMRVF